MGGRIKQMEGATKRLPLPIIGKVKCGEKSDRGYPRSLDYFKADGKYGSLFHDAYGEKPNTIQIVFPYEDAEMVCNEKYELRDGAGKLVADGDGENFRVWSEKKNAYVSVSTEQMPNVMEIVSSKYNAEWKVTLTLNFFIPKVRGVMGLWQFTTKGSASTIPQVRDYFDEFLRVNGKVVGVIFDLSVKMHKSNKPKDKSQYPVISLVANESLANLEMVNECKKPLLVE